MNAADIGYMMAVTGSLFGRHDRAARLVMAVCEARWCTWRAGMIALAKYERLNAWSLPADYSADDAIVAMNECAQDDESIRREAEEKDAALNADILLLEVAHA